MANTTILEKQKELDELIKYLEDTRKIFKNNTSQHVNLMIESISAQVEELELSIKKNNKS